MKLFIIGILAGIIGGMGIGGGTILIPGLTIFANIEQHLAQSINLLSFIPTAFIAILYHLKQKNIMTNIIFYIIISGLIGSFIGSYISIYINSYLLKKMFAMFLFIMGIYEIISKQKIGESKNEKTQNKKNKQEIQKK
ncbi:sulfite exporter TauE/SafE family protein [Thermoanaerobacterium sp. CMT5567-10]|uniref:sulfite exporter TauE/SafE family protein n=1 Tax=Thermoanaerobacterium sp. CMT5567-10 TaxID=3061989 RepID=UPI0026E0A89A|nr:sulfite exporter TauE/SafE family protein [Thermoanaerobacterium sp. CMT5567-10]WKV09248.1 sulfite exporter TauE/SafE family protein [Thermoanaerobacterium sp. CMT5567-10]